MNGIIEITALIVGSLASLISLLQKLYASSKDEWFARLLTKRPILLTLMLDAFIGGALVLLYFGVNMVASRLATASEIGEAGLDLMVYLSDITKALLSGSALLVLGAQAALFLKWRDRRTEEGKLEDKKNA